MPRVTRAALRSQELQEDPDMAASIPLPLTPIKGRAPLGETAGNALALHNGINTLEDNSGLKRGPGKGRKAKTTKKATCKKMVEAENLDTEVVQDDQHSSDSSAAEEACKELLYGVEAPTIDSIIMDDERMHVPVSPAAEEATQSLSPKQKTLHINVDPQATDEDFVASDRQCIEAEFLETNREIPGKEVSEQGLGIVTGQAVGEDNSFVDKTESRPSNRRISRIEDSVEALDALEEEIEKVGVLIPENTNVPPAKTKGMKRDGSTRKKNIQASRSKAQSKKPVATANLATTKGSARTARPPNAGATSQQCNATVDKTMATHTGSTDASQPALKKRISSIHKAPFQPSKSTKAPTRATFELPGEAVSRKLKEQREERLKREEEEKTKQGVSKTRSVRLSQAPQVKLNAVTKARLSMAKGDSVAATPAVNASARPKPSVARGSLASAAPSKRSSLSVARRTNAPPSTKTSAHSTRTPSFNASTAKNPDSSGAPSRPAPAGEHHAHLKVKGKEVFGRAKVELQEREKARREKEEAAKKARAEAAERGRVASRAWAEQQNQKKIAALKGRVPLVAVET